MQSKTFELIGVKAPLTQSNSEEIRIRTSELGFIDPSIILKTDETVSISIDKHIYTISTNIKIDTETNIVSSTQTITLLKENLGIQELLVNADSDDDPGYVEIVDYTVQDNVITLDSDEYNGKEAVIKYLTTK
jgi:hypothetical protein